MRNPLVSPTQTAGRAEPRDRFVLRRPRREVQARPGAVNHHLEPRTPRDEASAAAVGRGLEPERDALGDSAETSEVCGGFADVWGSGLWVLGARVPHAEASRRGFAEMHGML